MAVDISKRCWLACELASQFVATQKLTADLIIRIHWWQPDSGTILRLQVQGKDGLKCMLNDGLAKVAKVEDI